jgi:hypothetical protein
LNNDALARMRGAMPLSHSTWANVSGSISVAWFPATMKPPSRRRFSVPRQSRRVVAHRNGRTIAATKR